MNKVLSISFPLFAIIAIGFIAYRRRIINEETPSVLISFVYYFLLPPFLFMKILSADFGQGVDAKVLLAYFLAGAMVFLLAYIASRRRYAHEGKIVGIRSIASIAANTGYLGLPIVTLAYGERAVIPGVAIVLGDNLAVLVVGSFLLEAAGCQGVSWQKVVLNSLGNIARNPLIVTILLGTTYVLVFGVVPEPVRVLGKTLADATLPCALFALGATLAKQQSGPASTDRFEIVALKLLVHPLLAFVFARYIFDLSHVHVAIVVLMASMPVSVNTFIIASRYKAHVNEISSILFMTTCLSMVLVTLLLLVFS